MKPLTSAEFRNSNQIIFQTKVMEHNKLLAHDVYGGVMACKGDVDVIDLDKNGIASTECRNRDLIGLMFCKKFTEPSLVPEHGMDKIKEYALRNNTQIITQDDINEPLIETAGINVRPSVFTDGATLIHENQRPLGTLVKQIAPLDQGAKWAFDVSGEAGQFIVYSPK
ncbi:MAG: hypothetical protein AB9903_34800 [Vulcanimicrobiota bacterium]